MNPSFDLQAPDHFTAGTVGPPGQRVFYVQARQGPTIVTLKSEKEQVVALGEHLAGLLRRLPGAGEPPSAGEAALLEPVAPAWAIGTLGIGYDEAVDRILIEATELVEEEEDAEEALTQTATTEAETGASARFRITRPQAAAFVERARGLARAGRPLCPVCAQPRDPAGHRCPRANGHLVGRA